MAVHGFNVVDYIVFATILLSGFLAIFTGFVSEMYSLFNWAASYFLAIKLYPLVAPLVSKHINNPETIVDASIFIVFCICFIILALIGQLVKRFIVQGKTLTAIDRSLGFVFGLIRGALIVCLIYLVVTIVLWPDIDKPKTEIKLADNKDIVTENPAPHAVDSSEHHASDQDDEAEGEKSHEKPGSPAPKLLMEARTRGLLARGANMLREFVPEKSIQKTKEEYAIDKDKAQDKLDSAVKSYSP
jgi:uncharacterized membrane protein required for colicin V production